MQTTQSVFKRVEKKYQISQQQRLALTQALAGRVQEDQYGLHTICNLYLDTEDYALIRASIEKPIYKEKLRLRSYGVPGQDSTVYLELKKKFKGVVYKRRLPLTLREANAFIHGGVLPRRSSQILNELRYCMELYGHPQPAAFIAYERVALAGVEDPELRITFDSNVRFRTTQLDLSRGAWGVSMVGRDWSLMEVKVNDALPVWFSQLLSRFEIAPSSFSKYGTCYEQYLHNTQRREGLVHVS